MRIRVALISLGVVVALALLAAGALATGGLRIVPTCANVTVNPPHGGPLTIRLALKGRVTCAEAQRTVRAYYRPGLKCEGSGCFAKLPGGWLCSHVSAIEEKDGVQGGCQRKGASIEEYKVSSPTSTPGTLHLREFLSPDRKVWCVVEDRGCGTEPEPPTRSAEIDSHGDVRICSVPRLMVPPGGHVPLGCFQNWNKNAPILRYGQSDLYDGIRCTSEPNGVTCIVVAGVGKGKGFRVNKDEAVEVG